MKILNNKILNWIFFVSNRFATVDKTGGSGVTNFLSTLGIAFGVMTLICVISVMNGFQGTSINSLLEISSSHIKVSNLTETSEKDFYDFCKNNSLIKSVSKVYESQSLIVSSSGKQAVSFIKALPEDIFYKDLGFQNEISIVSGEFDLISEDSVILGSSLSKSLGVSIGSKINFLALSGSTDTALISQNRIFTVTGIFHSRNLEINQSFAFVNHKSAEKYFGKKSEPVYELKIKDYNQDAKIISQINNKFPELKCDSWKNFNKSFFSTLRIEKDMLFLLMLIIFIVVGINIYNGTRRLVFERSKEIAIMSALGGKKNQVKMIFIFKGFLNGLKGTVIGVLLGLFLTENISYLFSFMSDAEFYIQYFITMLINPENVFGLVNNDYFDLYASIPAVVKPLEIFLISLFGIFTPLFSSLFASRNVLKMNICEVLHEN